MGIQIGNIFIHIWVVIVIAIIIIAFIILVINRGIAAHKLQVGAGSEEMIGKNAQVLIALEPKGTVLIEGERWLAESEAGKVEAGEEVVVTRVEGLKLYVNKK